MAGARFVRRAGDERRRRVSSDHDIVVVGAGPVGLAAALELARLGYEVAILAPPRRSTDQRTTALLAGSIAFLDRIGVWPLVSAKAAAMRSLRIVDATGRLIRAPEVTFHASEIGLAAFGFNIANRDLIDGLEARLAATPVTRIAGTLETVAPGAENVVLHDASRAAITSRLVVAADGRRSRLRESTGIPVREWRYDQAALVVNLRHTIAHDDTSTEFHTETGPFTLVPLGEGRSSLVWVDRPDQVSRRVALPDAALADEIEARSASILGAIAIDGARQSFPLAGMTSARVASGRIALVGEAAHVFPPIGAQGLNLGYRDVAALGDALAGPSEDAGAPGGLAAYDRARRADILTRTMAVDTLNRTLLTGFIPVQAARGLGLFLLDRIPALRRAVMRQGVAPG